MSSSETSEIEFVAAVREYCGWLEQEPYEPESERFTALVLLSRLYATALTLPEVDPGSLPPFPNQGDAQLSARDEQVMARLSAFPMRSYWRLDGGGEQGGEKVTDDVARDLFLTYSAVRPLLDVFDSGEERRNGAVWSWRAGFWGDWGHHSSNAIQALHKYYHEKAWADE